MELVVRNVNQAFSEIFWKLKVLNLQPEQTRNGPAIVYPEMVTTVYKCPSERVLFHKGRDANPIFHLMESIWMLAGRNDAAFLQQFNKRMADFSDDNKVFNAAYGYRWRKHFINGVSSISRSLANRWVRSIDFTRRAISNLYK
jgi:hypothetical protein